MRYQNCPRERQEAIDHLYIMLEGHRHHFALELVNQINDNSTVSEIDRLATQAYNTPTPGMRTITTRIAKRYLRRFDGRLTGCINEPASYPTLISNIGDRIGIVME